MPIYEYRCGACGFQKEFLQRLNEKPLTVCPECGKRTFNKMVTAAGFQLKGTGWYATDFRGGSKSAAGTSNSDGKSADAKTTDTKKTADAKTDKPAAAEKKSAAKGSSKSTSSADASNNN